MTKDELKENLEEQQKADAVKADVFARVFCTEDGKRLLAYLVEMAPPAAPRFWDPEKGFVNDPLRAAWTDGRSTLVGQIHGILKGAKYYSDKIT